MKIAIDLTTCNQPTLGQPHGKGTPNGRKGYSRQRWRKGLFSVGSCLAAATVALGAQPPIGFERWTDPEVPIGVAASGLAFGLTPAEIYQQYAAQLVLGLPGSPQKDKRLIDIEVRSVGGGLGAYVFDVVWVVNTGSFELDSWFLFDLTEGEVHDLEYFDDAVILDIERYPKGNTWRFAVILQRNTGKFPWQVLTSATLDEIIDERSRTGSRPVDIDYYSVYRGRRHGRSGPPSGFDAVFIANTGGNYVDDLVAGVYTPVDSGALNQAGFQVVDKEVNSNPVSIWIKSFRPFLTYGGLTEEEAIFHHGHHGRVIDLEVLGSGEYSTVNLP